MAKRFNIDDHDDLFEMMTEYVHMTNDISHNIKRGKIIGITSDDVQVAPGACVRIPLNQIGNNIFIGLYCYLNGNVTIGNNVLIGPHCSITAGNHKFDAATGWFSARTEKDGDDSVVIGDGSWLASGVTVTPSVKIGKANLICAGSVLTKSTEDYSIMAGVPAKKIGHIEPDTGAYVWYSKQKKAES
ncbi:MAG: acyltransferase [Clostridia bacterium]|nr:acyltransferase [Clostridia bacterium]